MDSFDYVIVGGGSAGCVVAHRLAQGGHSVCVLEAGPRDTSPYIRIPAGFMKTYGNPALTWQFVHKGSAGTNGREIPFIQGKTLGGTSAVNGMVYSRGQRSDFDNWAGMGNDGWGYDDVLPYFRKNENFMSGGDSAYRGTNGRIPVTRTGWRDEPCARFIEGAVETGIPRNEDYNGARQAGVSYAQSAIYRGKRWSTAHGYLREARRKFGVKVWTDVVVRKIELKNRRAVGVIAQFRGEAEPRTIRAQVSVIVSAGAVNSPKLLQLSGIGPPDLLRQHGVPVMHALTGVGENLRDHYATRIVSRARPGVNTINQRVHGLPALRELMAWLRGRPTVLAVSPILVYAFCKSQDSVPDSDLALTFTPASYKLGMTRQLDDFPGVTCGTWVLRPESRGYIRIASADFRQNPVIAPNYLESERDRRVLLAGLKRVRAILRTPSMKQIVLDEILPGAGCETDDELLDFARQYGMTSYHLVGTCKMGPASDPLAVTDARLRVHGIDGLRVVDASVMPTTPSGNTCASTMMIAEKAADMLLADHAAVGSRA